SGPAAPRRCPRTRRAVRRAPRGHADTCRRTGGTDSETYKKYKGGPRNTKGSKRVGGLFRALTAPPPGSRARGPRRSARAGEHTRRWRIVDPAAEGVPHGLVRGEGGDVRCLGARDEHGRRGLEQHFS